MTKHLIIPQSLARNLDGLRRIEVHGNTVGEVLDELVQRYPVMHRYTLDDDGNIVQSLNVFLNGVEIRSLAGRGTPLDDEDLLIMVTPISGG